MERLNEVVLKHKSLAIACIILACLVRLFVQRYDARLSKQFTSTLRAIFVVSVCLRLYDNTYSPHIYADVFSALFTVVHIMLICYLGVTLFHEFENVYTRQFWAIYFIETALCTIPYLYDFTPS